MLATGGSAMKAIDVLIEHGVAEERIVFVNIISCPEGIQAMVSRFPKVGLSLHMTIPDCARLRL